MIEKESVAKFWPDNYPFEGPVLLFCPKINERLQPEEGFSAVKGIAMETDAERLSLRLLR